MAPLQAANITSQTPSPQLDQFSRDCGFTLLYRQQESNNWHKLPSKHLVFIKPTLRIKDNAPKVEYRLLVSAEDAVVVGYIVQNHFGLKINQETVFRRLLATH